ncbi:hypothetical protein BCR43DRAFT_486128 [Syncephalastrum racemosum]|uniref:Uncharacterized protein n=1 Tax=Syncephalastrum racemosum TaxID=13706 RepID=A0A1X2HPY9_SYNRA|nr:hypothetical protein BCR43DRAFT_486128 [Syncephalastrum racemosum]
MFFFSKRLAACVCMIKVVIVAISSELSGYMYQLRKQRGSSDFSYVDAQSRYNLQTFCKFLYGQCYMSNQSNC